MPIRGIEIPHFLYRTATLKGANGQKTEHRVNMRQMARKNHRRQLKFRILEQPDDVTCGPTSLKAIYDYFGESFSLGEIIQEIPMLRDGGTVGAVLACHALKKGYHASIYTYNVQLFDPTWFHPGIDLQYRLKQQLKYKPSPRLKFAAEAYLEFLRLGGEVKFRDLTPGLLRKYLDDDIPILTGLSATYLYRCAREIPETNKPDDIRGLPSGHFVVLCGYNKRTKKIRVADPYRSNPISKKNYYDVKIDRLIASILLGVLTYDANLLIITPRN